MTFLTFVTLYVSIGMVFSFAFHLLMREMKLSTFLGVTVLFPFVLVVMLMITIAVIFDEICDSKPVKKFEKWFLH